MTKNSILEDVLAFYVIFFDQKLNSVSIFTFICRIKFSRMGRSILRNCLEVATGLNNNLFLPLNLGVNCGHVILNSFYLLLFLLKQSSWVQQTKVTYFRDKLGFQLTNFVLNILNFQLFKLDSFIQNVVLLIWSSFNLVILRQLQRRQKRCS